jgi:hypothetical protein
MSKSSRQSRQGAVKPDATRPILRNSMTRTFHLVLIISLASCISDAQRTSGQTAWDYVGHEREAKLEDKNVASDFVSNDFGRLCIQDQSARLGYIGKDFQRLFIHFTDISKDTSNPYLYHVRGKTLVRNNICDFAGNMHLTSIRRVYDPDACENDIHPTVQGVSFFTYDFTEDTSQKQTGKFQGTAIVQWYLDAKKKLCYDDTWSCADGFTNNCFVGKWTSYSSRVSKPCNWADYRIPFSGDLDIGAGEFHPDDKYLKSGWNYFAAGDTVAWWK